MKNVHTEGLMVTPSSWMHSWLEKLDLRDPTWRTRYDADAIGLALVDLVGDDLPHELDPHGMDVLTEFILHLDEEMNRLVQAALKSNPAFNQAVLDCDWRFRSFWGSSREFPWLRRARRDALLALMRAIIEPMLARFDQIEHAMDMMNRRHCLPSLPPESLVADPKTQAPDTRAVVREESRDAVKEFAREASPEAFLAVRDFFLGDGAVSASEAGARNEVSATTMSRQLKSLRGIVRTRLGPVPQLLRPLYRQAIILSFWAERGNTG